MHNSTARTLRRLLGIGLTVETVAAACGARASEGGASFYLLGSGGPGAAILPPVPGVFLQNTAYLYHGEAGAERQFVIGGNLVSGLRGTIAADFPTVLWVPPTKILGGTLAVGGAIPFGQPWVNVNAVLTGPLGNQIGVSKGDTAFVMGDPVLTAALGWTRGETHFQIVDMLNVPVGQYREGDLANLAFHRWATDVSGAVTWHDAKSGWDLSAKTGFTFNGKNPYTDYSTGTEWHLEAAVEKALTPAWSLAAQAYHFNQVTGDSGPGAILGAFKGRVTGVGGAIAYNFKLAGRPATLRLHGTTEFDVQNRLQGHSIWLDFSFPLAMRLPH